MVFKTRKIPRHLIIEDEYKIREKPRMGFIRKLTLWVFVLGITCAVSMGLLQI